MQLTTGFAVFIFQRDFQFRFGCLGLSGFFEEIGGKQGRLGSWLNFLIGS
jgi:hypothetical protein